MAGASLAPEGWPEGKAWTSQIASTGTMIALSHGVPVGPSRPTTVYLKP
jgi:hypothetical protein